MLSVQVVRAVVSLQVARLVVRMSLMSRRKQAVRVALVAIRTLTDRIVIESGIMGHIAPPVIFVQN